MHWISLLIPGQYTQLCACNWLLVIPWCPSYICCSTSPLSAGGDEDGLPMEDYTIFNSHSVPVVPVGLQGLRDILRILRPASNDCLSKGSQKWVSPGEFL